MSAIGIGYTSEINKGLFYIILFLCNVILTLYLKGAIYYFLAQNKEQSNIKSFFQSANKYLTPLIKVNLKLIVFGLIFGLLCMIPSYILLKSIYGSIGIKQILKTTGGRISHGFFRSIFDFITVFAVPVIFIKNILNSSAVSYSLKFFKKYVNKSWILLIIIFISYSIRILFLLYLKEYDSSSYSYWKIWSIYTIIYSYLDIIIFLIATEILKQFKKI